MRANTPRISTAVSSAASSAVFRDSGSTRIAISAFSSTGYVVLFEAAYWTHGIARMILAKRAPTSLFDPRPLTSIVSSKTLVSSLSVNETTNRS